MAAQLKVTTNHSPLAFMLYMTKINLTVDGGETEKIGWGGTSLGLEPGSHEIEISFQYFGRPAGKASATVDVADGSSTTVAYRAPMVVMRPGKITVSAG
jgi:hypothetical protein